MSRFDRVHRETGWVDLNVPVRRRFKRWQALLGLLLPVFLVWTVADYILTTPNAEASQAPSSAPPETSAPPKVRECVQQVVNGTCYIIPDGACLSDCPVGLPQVVGDPPAIKVKPKARPKRGGHPKRTKPASPPVKPPPPAAPSGPALPA